MKYEKKDGRFICILLNISGVKKSKIKLFEIFLNFFVI